MAWKMEENFEPKPFFDELVQKEREESHLHGGMTVFGRAKPSKKGPQQLKLF
jgi:hypothetical protein